MRIGLRVQFTLLTVALVAVTVFGASYFFTRQEREVLLREMTRRGSTIARNLAVISTDPLISNDTLALTTFVESTMKNEGVSYSFIVNEKGIILAHSRVENVGRAYVEPLGVRPISNEEILIQPYRDENGQEVTDIALPVVLRNAARVGAVHVGLSQSAADSYVAQAFREAVTIAGCLLVIGILIAVFLISLMLKPLTALVQGVKALGEGNLGVQIRPEGANEFALLARAFNEMTGRLKGLYIGMLRAMAKALESRDKFAGGHDQRVAEYAARCAQHIGLQPEDVESIRLAAQVQNLGHIAVPDTILEKTGKLTAAEYEKLKEHPVLGAEILNQVPALRGAVPLVKHHHERYDGEGYPSGLKGKDIPLGARILAVADAFDAMTSAQKYRPAIEPLAAVAELQIGAGTQFDPEIVEAFIEALSLTKEEKPRAR